MPGDVPVSYAIGIRLPVLMERMGLVHVDIQLPTTRSVISSRPSQIMNRPFPIWSGPTTGCRRDMAVDDTQASAEGFMNHGMRPPGAESYYSRQRKLPPSSSGTEQSFHHQTLGLLISYGYKP